MDPHTKSEILLCNLHFSDQSYATCNNCFMLYLIALHFKPVIALSGYSTCHRPIISRSLGESPHHDTNFWLRTFIRRPWRVLWFWRHLQECLN